MTRTALGLAAAFCASLASTGCMTDGEWSVSRMLGWDDQPRTPKVPKADLATAERVETLGRRIIGQNTFTGIEPLFHTLGVPEVVLFHRGTGELMISEGLAKQCKTEAELAAVLCSELGQMVAEKKAARRAGADRDSFPEIGVPTGSGLAGGTPTDPSRAAELALLEKQRAKNAAGEAADAGKLSRDLMRGAGFDPAELERVAPLLKQSTRGAAIQKQMSASAPAPKWEW
jgi:predicted Zn-dependent protease